MFAANMALSWTLIIWYNHRQGISTPPAAKPQAGKWRRKKVLWLTVFVLVIVVGSLARVLVQDFSE